MAIRKSELYSSLWASCDALDARLVKTCALKAWMMQQLLIGRIRLVHANGRGTAPAATSASG